MIWYSTSWDLEMMDFFFKLTGFIKMVRLKIYTDVVRVACMLQAFQKIGLIFTGKIFFSNALCSKNFQNVQLRPDFVEI